jgi:hypothetical protein
MAPPNIAFVKASGRFSKWRRVLIFLGAFLLAVVLFYREEDWRGKRAWEQCKQELAARGQILETQSLIPPRVPDDQNVLKAPKMAVWFEARYIQGSTGGVNNFVITHWQGPTTLAKITSRPPGANSTRGDADVFLDYSSPFQNAPLRTNGAGTKDAGDVTFNDVALADAILPLAISAGRNIQFDPVLFQTNAPAGLLAGHVGVTVKWKNLTADQALFALLKNYGLVLLADPATRVERVTVLNMAAAQSAAQQFARSPAVREQVAPLLRRSLGASLVSPLGFLLVQAPLDQVKPIRLVFQGKALPSPEEIKSFMKEFFPAEMIDYAGNGFTVEATNDGALAVRLSIQSAGDFLAWNLQLEPDLDLIRQALQRPQAQRDDYQQGPPAMPSFVTFRTVAQTLAQRAQCHLLLGQPDLALRDLTLMHDLLRVCDTRPLGLVPAMFYVAVTGLYTSVVADGLRLQAWREPELAALQAQLRSINNPYLVATALATQSAFACRKMESLTPAEYGKALTNSSTLWYPASNPATNSSSNERLLRWLSRPGLQPVGRWLKNWLFPTNPWLKTALFAAMPDGWRYQNMAAAARLQQELIDSIDLPHGLILPDKVRLYERDFEKARKARAPFAWLASLFSEKFSRGVMTAARNQTFVNQAVIACALERFRLARGHWPDALDELVPRFLERVPRDLIGGRPLKYRLGENGTFLLYSVGWNGRDDFGVAGQDSFEGDWVWSKNWP